MACTAAIRASKALRVAVVDIGTLPSALSRLIRLRTSFCRTKAALATVGAPVILASLVRASATLPPSAARASISAWSWARVGATVQSRGFVGVVGAEVGGAGFGGTEVGDTGPAGAGVVGAGVVGAGVASWASPRRGASRRRVSSSQLLLRSVLSAPPRSLVLLVLVIVRPSFSGRSQASPAVARFDLRPAHAPSSIGGRAGFSAFYRCVAAIYAPLFAVILHL